MTTARSDISRRKRIAPRPVGLLIAAACVALAAAPAAAQQSSADCDRACLDGIMTAYLAALAARDPNAVPWAAKVRRTENAAEIASVDSLWKTGG